jgi:K+-sensing histidine kinase KdpD
MELWLCRSCFSRRLRCALWLERLVARRPALPAVILTAFFAGLWPGVMVAILSTLTAWYFFLRPVRTFMLDPAELLALVFFIVIAGISIALIQAFHIAVDRLQQERARAERLAEQREIMFAELQHRISNNLQLVAAWLGGARRAASSFRRTRSFDHEGQLRISKWP